MKMTLDLWKRRNLGSLMVGCMMVLLIFFVSSMNHRNPLSDQFGGLAVAKMFDKIPQKDQFGGLAEANVAKGGKITEEDQLGGLAEAADAKVVEKITEKDQSSEFTKAKVFEEIPQKGREDNSSQSVDKHNDKLLEGVPSAGFDERSCLSRYQSVMYRKASPHKPSPYLLSRLRNYEILHKKCGPYTKSYNRTMKILKSDRNIKPTDCNYVVWVSHCGLGNRILSLASTFLYALLTNRVLLVYGGNDITDLFCEPFPETSWLLTLDFPLDNLKKFKKFNTKPPRTYGVMLRSNSINGSSGSMLPFLYVHLSNNYDKHDKRFFCDQDQTLLRKVPWLIMKSNMYFLPSLFLMSSFEQELKNLFPSKETVFHHLGRYLFNPSNAVWELITTYYTANLVNADERVGIQIRTFHTTTDPFPYVLDQIRACFLKKKLLPEVSDKKSFVTPPRNQKKIKAVLVTSLISWYSEKIRNMYRENVTVTGEVIKVFQPSSEQYQQSQDKMQNRKAWAEMYLLSLTDVLVASGSSTFGYVAQSLGGLKPWILYKPKKNHTVPDPPCVHARSMEPCFHHPPSYDCKTKALIDVGAVVPHLKHCEDKKEGIKLVDRVKL